MKKINPALSDSSENKYSLLWFLGGAAAGVGLWYLLKPTRPAPVPLPGSTQTAALPPIAPPSRLANLASVALRFDQVKTLYHGGFMLPDQALAESDALLAAANQYAPTDPGAAASLIADLEAFKRQVNDFRQFMATNPSGIPLPGSPSAN